MDAPAHYAQGRAHLNEVPSEQFFGPGVMIDMTQQAKTDPDYLMTIKDIEVKTYSSLRTLTHAIYREFFHKQKLKKSLEIFFFYILNIFAQNIDCGYTLEPPRRGGSNEYPQYMFWIKSKRNRYAPAYPSFTI